MGAAAAKCSDVSQAPGKSTTKPLDATDSELEEEVSEEEDEAEEQEDEEKAREAAEDALNQGIQRGRSATFKEAIDHATSVGIDVEKILKAEAKLEEHKALRRREAFESDVKDYLDNEKCHDIEVCREKLKTGTEYGVGDKILQRLRDRIEELDVGRALEEAEVNSARLLIEKHTRKFVQACVRGRPITWIDLDTGEKIPATLYIDLVLHNARVYDSSKSELGYGDIPSLRAKGPRDADSNILSKEGFKKLSEEDKKFALCINPGKLQDPWIIVEPNYDMRDEAICAFMVLAGACIDDPLRSVDSTKRFIKPPVADSRKEDQPPAAPPPLPPPAVREEEPPASKAEEPSAVASTAEVEGDVEEEEEELDEEEG